LLYRHTSAERKSKQDEETIVRYEAQVTDTEKKLAEQTAVNPTAVTLQSFSAQGQNLTMVLLVIGALLLLTVGALWRLRQQTR
jgi:hypothetical protein